MGHRIVRRVFLVWLIASMGLASALAGCGTSARDRHLRSRGMVHQPVPGDLSQPAPSRPIVTVPIDLD